MTIKQLEIRSVQYIPRTAKNEDTHVVKALAHYEDGHTEPLLRTYVDYKRPFYVTKKPERVYKDNRECTPLSSLDAYRAIQSDLTQEVSKALGQSWRKTSMNSLAASPFLYGSDQTSEFLLKQELIEEYGRPDTESPYQYAALDIENNMDDDNPFINVKSVSRVGETHVAVLKSFLQGIENPQEALQAALKKYLGKYLDDGLKVTFTIHDDEADVIKAPINTLHEWKPDIVGVWSIGSDLPKIEARCKILGIDIAQIFKDPGLPDSLARYQFHKGPTKRITASGVEKSLAYSEQWDWVRTSSSWQWLDAMQTFRELRSQEANRPAYGLGAILQEVLGERKLHFKEADHLSGGEWHSFMQKYYPVEYVIYNVFDTYGMVLLDKVTKDMSVKVPVQMGELGVRYLQTRSIRSDSSFASFIKKRHLVPGTIPPKWAKAPEESLPLSGWILTLPSYLYDCQGYTRTREFPHVQTNISILVLDSDIVSSYPSCMRSLNVSKACTVREVIGMKDCSKDFRLQNINMMAGPSNSVMYCVNMYGYPSVSDVLANA